MGKTFRIPISANGPRAHIYITNCCPYWEMCGGCLIECMYRCRCGCRGRDTSACVINCRPGVRAIISLDSVLLQLYTLSLCYVLGRRKTEKYLNTLLKKYFAFWENIYIIVVFIFCCCEVSVNYVGLDTFNRLLAPGQSGEKDRFSMTNLHYTETGQRCQGGATQTQVLAIEGNARETDTEETVMREEERY